MNLRKWNYETHEYDHYEVPDNWTICLFTEDMDKIVNCVQCGKEVKFGTSYTSREVHNGIGLGYNVCKECLNKEVEREFSSKKERVENE